jgi:carbon storage regulator CsrA
MLVLTRRPNESIVFPALGVTVRVLAVRGTSVRLGIEAPRGVVVMRDELLGPLQKRPAPSVV